MNNGNNIIDTAVQFLGTPYKWGGTSTSGFDCSGLTQYVYSQNGVSIPRTAQEQYNKGTAVDMSNLQAGDLVFFNGYKGKSGVGHVGIYIGNGQYIHAPKSGDVVKISNLNSRSDYVGARRYTNTTGAPQYVNNVSNNGSGWLDGFWTALVKLLAVVLLLMLAVLFFMQAFDIKLV